MFSYVVAFKSDPHISTGVQKEERVIIKDHYIPHTVEHVKLGQGQSHAGVKGQESTARSSERNTRNRKNTTKTQKLDKNVRFKENQLEMSQFSGNTNEKSNMHRLKFAAIYEPTNSDKTCGKWVFVEMIDQKVIFILIYVMTQFYLLVFPC